MTDVRPLILLDVDGVLNHFPTYIRSIDEQWVDEPCLSFKANNGFMINARHKVLDFFRDLDAGGTVEIQWLTTWADDANRLLSEQFGFPHFTVAGAPPLREKNGWWKLVIVKKIVDQDPLRKIVWIDDDIAFDRSANDFIDSLHRASIDNFLAVSPHPERALNDAELEQITRFLG